MTRLNSVKECAMCLPIIDSVNGGIVLLKHKRLLGLDKHDMD